MAMLLKKTCLALGCVVALLVPMSVPAAAPAEEDPLASLVWCDQLEPSDSPIERDCVQGAGAAIGAIDPLWRQRMPAKVRWITARDALSSCARAEGPYGKMIDRVGDRGCVWLSEDTCTILTAVYVAHAEIGNALRSCAVK